MGVDAASHPAPFIYATVDRGLDWLLQFEKMRRSADR
jgi:hypothetical protein